MITSSDRNLRDNQRGGGYRNSARAVATELYTLGGVRVLQQGSPLDVTLGARHLALLIFLFHERRPMHPVEVVELLGHGHDHDRELDGLKRAVKWLNQHVPFVNIRLTAETVEGVSGVWLDTMDVEAAIDARKPARVADLYVGEFLEGFESGAHAFEEWANKERGRLKRAWDHAITRAAREAEAEGKWRTAAAWWKISVARAPMRSEPLARLLEAYARTGRREEAVQTYADYTERLSRSGIADVADAVRQVIARFPLLRGIAASPFPAPVQDKAPAGETPETDRPSRVWDLEPAPAPADAFDLTFELPEVEIPAQLARPQVAPAAGSATNEGPAPSPRSFHVLDEPLVVDFGVGSRNRVSKSADELVVETVAMSFEKIAARVESDSSDGNGAQASSEDVWDPPEGFTDNSNPERRDGNGKPGKNHAASAERTDPPPKSDQAREVRHEPEPSGDRPVEREREAKQSIQSGPHPVQGAVPPGESARPPRNQQERQRNRDLYRATAAILAAFVDDDVEEDEVGGNGDVGFRAQAAPRVHEMPERHVPASWVEFADAQPEDELAEAMSPGHPDEGAYQPHDEGLSGQTVLFDPPGSPEFSLEDLDLDEFELYGGHGTRVRHEVTSIRKPWDPFLRRAWTGVCQWLAETFGALRDRAGRKFSERYPTSGPEELSAPAEYLEPWAREPAYEPSDIVFTDEVFTDEPEPPQTAPHPSQERGEDQTPWSEGSRENGQRRASAQYEGRLQEEAPVEWQEEASVEWHDEWQDASGHLAVDEPYGVEVDSYSPTASSSFEPTVGEVLGSLLRRYWYAPVGVVLVVAALAVANSVGLFGGSGGEAADAELSSPSPSLPKVTVRTPGFIETSISRIGRLFAGSILDGPGEWILVADLNTNRAEEPAGAGSDASSGSSTEVTAAALTMALEADLMQARHFFVFPRGRALVALGSNADESAGALTMDKAISVAAAQGVSAVIGGALYGQGGGADDSLVIEVVRPSGELVYHVSRRVSEPGGRLTALAELSKAVRLRLGEPSEDLDGSVPLSSVLSRDPAALNSYAAAFEFFQTGRYREAGLAATAATRRDSSFAAAHFLLARSMMALGARRQARSAMQAAVETSDKTSERERLRILGNWLALTGRLSEAALTYDELFNRHRDDVGALRSQAVVQRMLGARGDGLGNLQVAQAIDRFDWPPLTQLARDLGYQGRLPSADSLKALTDSAPSREAND